MLTALLYSGLKGTVTTIVMYKEIYHLTPLGDEHRAELVCFKTLCGTVLLWIHIDARKH